MHVTVEVSELEVIKQTIRVIQDHHGLRTDTFLSKDRTEIRYDDPADRRGRDELVWRHASPEDLKAFDMIESLMQLRRSIIKRDELKRAKSGQ